MKKRKQVKKVVRTAKTRTWTYRTLRGTTGYYSGHPVEELSLKKQPEKKN